MPLTVDSNSMPIVVTGTTDASSLIISRGLYINYIYWYKPTTTGHLLSITDPNLRTIAKACCSVADQEVLIPISGIYDGVYCDDMDSGELYIYHR